MGLWGFDDFKAYCKFQLGQNPDLDVSTNYYEVWVNAAYRQLTSAKKIFGVRFNLYFPELETTTTSNTADGTAYVSVPADCIIVREIEHTTDDHMLTNISWSDYLDTSGRADTDAEGPPTEWVRRGSRIYLSPTPDATDTLTIYYKQRVTDLSGTGATAIANEWDEAILQLAVIKGLMWMKDYEKANVEKEAWVEMMKGLAGLYDTEEKAREEYFEPHSQYSRGFEYGR